MRFRIRTIKPELYRDEKIARLPIPVRYLWGGLIAHADDEGRLEGHPSAIRSLVFPFDDLTAKKVDDWLGMLEQAGVIYRYQADDLERIELRNWARHQKVNRPTPSSIPSYQSVNGHPSRTERARSAS